MKIPEIGVIINSKDNFKKAIEKKYKHLYFDSYKILNEITESNNFEEETKKNQLIISLKIVGEKDELNESIKLITFIFCEKDFKIEKTTNTIIKIKNSFIDNFVPVSNNYIIFMKKIPFYFPINKNEKEKESIHLRAMNNNDFDYKNLYNDKKLKKIAEKKKKTIIEILIKYNLKKENYLLYNSDPIELPKFDDFDLNEEEMENLDLLKFYHLNYIPCNCNNCPFPMIIKFNKKQIFTSCIKKHKSIYNSLKIILLKKNYTINKTMCPICDKNILNNEKWYCHICDYYYHNNDNICGKHLHPLLYYNNIFNYCPNHLQIIEYYCEECERGICNKCNHPHKNKDFEYLDSFVKKYMKSIYETKLYFSHSEKFFFKQYEILENKNIFNFEIIQNVKNIFNQYPKVLGNFYFGEISQRQRTIFKDNFLRNYDYILFLIVNNNYFFSYDMNKTIKLFEFTKNNFREKITINQQSLTNSETKMNLNDILKIIFEKINVIKINCNEFKIYYIDKTEEKEEKKKLCCFKVEKLMNNNTFIIKKNIVPQTNELPTKSNLLFFDYDPENEEDFKLLYYLIEEQKKKLIFKNIKNNNNITSGPVNFDIYKVFHYNTSDKEILFFICHNLTMYYTLCYEDEDEDENDKIIHLKKFNSYENIFQNHNITECFISGSQIVLLSDKTKFFYLPLRNIYYE